MKKKNKKTALTRKERAKLDRLIEKSVFNIESSAVVTANLIEYLEYADSLFRDENGNWRIATKQERIWYYAQAIMLTAAFGKRSNTYGTNEYLAFKETGTGHEDLLYAYDAAKESEGVMLIVADEVTRLVRDAAKEKPQQLPADYFETYVQNIVQSIFQQKNLYVFVDDKMAGLLSYREINGWTYVSEVIVDKDFRDTCVAEVLWERLLERQSDVTTREGGMNDEYVPLLKDIGFEEMLLNDEIEVLYHEGNTQWAVDTAGLRITIVNAH